MTIEWLQKCASGLAENDFYAYAERVAEIDPLLGVCEMLNAEAAEDGRALPLSHWPGLSHSRRQRMDVAGIDTPEQARRWWYTDQLGLAPDDPAIPTT